MVFLLSQRVAEAEPNNEMLAFARELGSAYLLDDVEPGRTFLDEIFLEVSAVHPPAAWRWSAGVNYFCAQGDGRWWQDHRIPGGMAFSVNSVGHMARSGLLAQSLQELRAELDLTVPEDARNQPVSSLLKALELAMMTIDRAADTPYGKATELVPLTDARAPLPVSQCPVQLPKPLVDKNYCTYAGYYDTDQTLPTAYFLPGPSRPETDPQLMLDFTYLFDDNLDNPDYIVMGKGRRIRDSGATGNQRLSRRRRAIEEKIPVAQSERLLRALRERTRS